MTTKHDAAKATANLYVTRQQAAKNASSGRAFEAQQRRAEGCSGPRARPKRHRGRARCLCGLAREQPRGAGNSPTE